MGRALGIEKQTLTLRLPREDCMRLRATAQETRKTLSQLFEDIVLTYNRTSPAWRRQELLAELRKIRAELSGLAEDEAVVAWFNEIGAGK